MGKTEHADFGTNVKPQPGDPAGMSAMEKQYASDRAAYDETSKANRANTIGPNNVQQYIQNPDGTWTVQTDLRGSLGKANTDLGNQYSQMVSQALPTGEQARDQAINAAYGQATSRLDPQWDRRMEAQRTQLLNQGLDPSSEAFKNSMQDANFARNDAYSSAMNNAIGQGNAAGNQIFQNAMAGRNNQLDQIQALQALALKTPAINPVGTAPSAQWMNAQIADNNFAIQQATNTEQQNADTAQGVGQAVATAATIAAMA